MTHEIGHMTQDRWGKVKVLSKFQLSSTYGLAVVVAQLRVLRHHGRYQQVMLKAAPVGDPGVGQPYTFLQE